MANAVLVVDMVRGFLEEGNPLYCGDRARRIIPNVRRLLEHELARGSAVFFVCDRHTPDDPEFKMFPPHCIDGTADNTNSVFNTGGIITGKSTDSHRNFLVLSSLFGRAPPL